MTHAARGSPFLSMRQLSRRPEALGSREETHSLVGPASDLFSLSGPASNLFLSLFILARSLVSLVLQTAVMLSTQSMRSWREERTCAS
jgi:hypothetical protein